jgi:hypothetical protein
LPHSQLAEAILSGEDWYVHGCQSQRRLPVFGPTVRVKTHGSTIGTWDAALEALDRADQTKAADRTDPSSQNNPCNGRPNGASADTAGVAAGDRYSLPTGTP